MKKGKTYEVYYKNELAFSISNGGDVNIINANIMPMDIYLEESADIDDKVNNIVNFNTWCSERIIPLDRKYAKEILACLEFDNVYSLQERAEIGITTRCLSLNDCFWVKEASEEINWDNVSLFQNSLENSVFETALLGKGFTLSRDSLSPDINTDGKAAKAWRRNGDKFFLLKADNGNDSVIKETEASDIMHSIFGDYIVPYTKDYFSDEPVSVCCCFTDEKYNMVKAEYYAIYSDNNDIDFSLDIETKWKDQMDRMVIADYFTGNIDRHARNWGVIYECRDSKFYPLTLSPIYDFDHAFESKGIDVCQPYRYIGKTISLEDACFNILQNKPELFDKITDLDLTNYKYGSFVKNRIDRIKDRFFIEQPMVSSNMSKPNNR